MGGSATGEQIRLKENLGGADDLQDQRDEQDSAQLRPTKRGQNSPDVNPTGSTKFVDQSSVCAVTQNSARFRPRQLCNI